MATNLFPTFDASHFGRYAVENAAYNPDFGGNQYNYQWGLLPEFAKQYGNMAGMSPLSHEYQLNSMSGNLSDFYGPNAASTNPNAFNLQIKSGDKEGTWVPYSLQNGQYVPDSGSVWKSAWDTNESDRNVTAALMAAGWFGAPYLTEAFSAGGYAGPMAGAEGAGYMGGIGAEGLGTAGAGGIGTAGGGSAGAGAGTTASGLPSLGSALNYGKIGASLLGGLAGMRSSKPSSTTTTQNLPPELQGLLGDVVGRARQLGDMPFKPYTGGGGLLPGAEGLLTDTMSGKYLNNNPYIEDMIRQQQDQLQGRLGTTLMGSGSFGNANAVQSGVQGMSDAANKLRFDNYSAERQRQMGAAALAPSIYGMGRQEYEAEQNWPFRQYEALLAPFRMQAGGSTTTQQPGGSSAAGLLGGLLAGGQLYNTWFGGK